VSRARHDQRDLHAPTAGILFGVRMRSNADWVPASRFERILASVTWDRGEVAPFPWHVLVNSLASATAMPSRLRTVCLKAAGLSIPWAAQVKPGVTFRTPKVKLGKGSSINYGCVFDNRALVTIGRRVGIGIGVKFVTSGHDMSNPECRAGLGSLSEINVGDGAWIGSSVTIIGGVTIGAGAVVAAGAVVVRDCEDNGLYGGVPAKLIRWLPPRNEVA
jgi:maltose O-acetyltransferase